MQGKEGRDKSEVVNESNERSAKGRSWKRSGVSKRGSETQEEDVVVDIGNK